MRPQKVERGDIIYGRRGDIGRHALITEKEKGWLCGTGCIRISLGNQILNPVYLHYYLCQKDVIGWIYNQAIGATMPNLNTTIIRNIPITYPSLSTQTTIAKILSAYVDLIENDTRRIQILEEMASRVYREWFVHFRFPGNANVKMVNSDFGMIPEGWKVKRVDEVSSIYRGRSYKSSELTAGLPFLNLKNVKRGGGFRYDGLKQYSGIYKETQIAYPGDIIHSFHWHTL